MAKECVLAECDACCGTGLYSGMCEGEGVAVICLDCNGTGCKKIEYKPFTKRRSRTDIHIVRRSRGRLIATGVGPVGDSITYKEFAAGKMPR